MVIITAYGEIIMLYGAYIDIRTCQIKPINVVKCWHKNLYIIKIDNYY